MHQKFVRTLARAKADTPWYYDFACFLRLAGRGCGFRARNRARTCSVCQSILLITEMILHTLIAIVALKAAEINRSEVTKIVDTFAPPCPESMANNTARKNVFYIQEFSESRRTQLASAAQHSWSNWTKNMMQNEIKISISGSFLNVLDYVLHVEYVIKCVAGVRNEWKDQVHTQ